MKRNIAALCLAGAVLLAGCQSGSQSKGTDVGEGKDAQMGVENVQEAVKKEEVTNEKPVYKEASGKMARVSVTIEFVTNNENNFEGLDLLVTVLPESIGQLGQGTKDEPFLVGSVQDLKTVETYFQLTGDSKVYIKQFADIDMAGETFTP